MTIANVQLATTETDITTAGPGETRAVLAMLLCNTDTTARVVTIYAIPDQGAASATTTILSALTIPAGDTYIWTANEKFILGAGDKISGICDVASKVSATVTFYNL